MRSGTTHRPVCGGLSWMARRLENEQLLGMLRVIPWVEVSVNSCQLDRSCCGVGPGTAVGSEAPFRELTGSCRSLDKIALGYGVFHAESAYPLVPVLYDEDLGCCRHVCIKSKTPQDGIVPDSGRQPEVNASRSPRERSRSRPSTDGT